MKHPVYIEYLHFMLELYGKIIYFIGTNTADSRRIGRKIVKEKFTVLEICPRRRSNLY